MNSAGKVNSEDHDYSNDTTLKSTTRPETEKNSASFNEDSIELSEQMNMEKLTGKQK